MGVEKWVVQKTIATYGKKNQALICMEEPAELVQAVSKMLRCDGNNREDAKHNLIEEMADTIICLENLKQLFDISDDEINEVIYQKQERSLKRIAKYEGKHGEERAGETN